MHSEGPLAGGAISPIKVEDESEEITTERITKAGEDGSIPIIDSNLSMDNGLPDALQQKINYATSVNIRKPPAHFAVQGSARYSLRGANKVINGANHQPLSIEGPSSQENSFNFYQNSTLGGASKKYNQANAYGCPPPLVQNMMHFDE